ncbi:Maf family protein [Candidatus Ferrigenium straubiae]|jgi:septum formation protein|uniref:Maf family protein n=1 Tax=Candidatus Ferrigenium straubiae TaxID=2919506 RepID=UPI003F4AF3D6
MAIIQPRIYLASQSPRRRELLKQIGINFELLLLRSDPYRNPDVDETPHDGEPPEEYVQRVCRAKAEAGYASLKLRSLPPFPVLAADTTVVLDNRIFGKPDNAGHAAEMLRQLSGCEHKVFSAVAVALGDHVETALSVSTVRFATLDEERIQRYLLTREYTDKAGGYAIQGYAGAFVEHIAGSYSGVMGLPLFETVQLLKHFDYPTP